MLIPRLLTKILWHFCPNQELWSRGNGSETAFVSRQRLGKHVPVSTDTYATIEVLLETVCSSHSMQGVIRKKIRATESVLYGSLEEKSSVKTEPLFRKDLCPEVGD
jgi:hypothetical protein